MACDGSSGCGCTCVCSCIYPQIYYATGIYAAPRPIPNPISLVRWEVPVGGGAPPVFRPLPLIDSGGGGGVAPPGAGPVRGIIDWGSKPPVPPGPHIGKTVGLKERGWDQESFLSPPPLDAMKGREPGPVLFAPTNKVQGPPEESRVPEVPSLAPTFDVGDSSGSLQPWTAGAATALAVMPPDSRVGIEPPAPYSPAAIAPPQAGEFLQGAGLGPGAGIGSEGSDPTEDNGSSAPMDSVVAEDAFPPKEEAEDPAPVEPGDAPWARLPTPHIAPSFPGHPQTASPKSIETTKLPLVGQEQPVRPTSIALQQSPLTSGGGRGLHPAVLSKPSVRPGVGLAIGRANSAVQSAVAAGVRAAAAQHDHTERESEVKRKILADHDYRDAMDRRREAQDEVLNESSRRDAAIKEAETQAHGDRSVRARIQKEIDRQDARHETKLAKLSSGSGDIVAARRAEMAGRAARETRDRATAVSAATSGAQQKDRIRRADAEVRRAERESKRLDREASRTKDPVKRAELEANAKMEKESAKYGRNAAEYNRQRLKDPKARKQFQSDKVAAKKAVKAAKKAAKDARLAARRARNAARYGPSDAATAAAKEAERKRIAAERAGAEAEAKGKKVLDPESPPVQPLRNPVPHGHDGGNASCVCNPPCPVGWTCECECQETEPPVVGWSGGSAGRLHPVAAAVAPPESGNGAAPIPPPAANKDEAKDDEKAVEIPEGTATPEQEDVFIEEPTEGVVLNDGSILILFDGKVYHLPREFAIVMKEVEEINGKEVPSWHMKKLKDLIEEIGGDDQHAFPDFIKRFQVQIDLKDSAAVTLEQFKAAARESWKVGEAGLLANPVTAVGLGLFYLGYGAGLATQDKEEAKSWLKRGLFVLGTALLAWGVGRYGPRVFGRIKDALRKMRSTPDGVKQVVAEEAGSLTVPRGGRTAPSPYVRSAIDSMKEAPANAQARARVWENKAREIESKVDGWKGAEPMLGKTSDGGYRTLADGSIVFTGDKGGNVLVVSKSGSIFVGKGHVRDLIDFEAGKVLYDKFRLR